jgi:hypothetical protein
MLAAALGLVSAVTCFSSMTIDGGGDAQVSLPPCILRALDFASPGVIGGTRLEISS